jgi:hypothetical protein
VHYLSWQTNKINAPCAGNPKQVRFNPKSYEPLRAAKSAAAKQAAAAEGCACLGGVRPNIYF